MTLSQRLNEIGIWNPFSYSRRKCQQTWQDEKNDSKIIGNRPIDYVNKNPEIIERLCWLVSCYAKKEDRILEIGCNAGANLNGLWQMGLKNLMGIDINPNALYQIKRSFPEMFYEASLCLRRGDALGILWQYKPDIVDLTFTMAVLMHIHPSQNALFDEMVRVTKKHIITIEDELQGCNYIFPRNYQRVFESRGCRQVYTETIRNVKGYEGYTVRVFEVKKP